MTRKLFVTVAILFGLLLCFQESAAQLCNAVRKHTSIAPTPDAFSAAALGDFTWVTGACPSTAPATVAYTSGWLNQDASTVKIKLGTSSEPRPSRFAIKRSLHWEIDSSSNTVTNFNISVEFQIDFEVSVNDNDETVNAVGSIWKAAKGFPVAAAGNLALEWNGQLLSTSTETQVSDPDLFDGAPATILIEASATADDSAKQMLELQLYRAADMNIRLNPLNSLPSALPWSIRGAFSRPPSALDGYEPISIAGGKAVVSDIPTEAGVLVQARATCNGADCSNDMVRVVQGLVPFATQNQGICDDVEIIADATTSSLVIDLFGSETRTFVRGISATTRMLFRCPSTNGYIGVHLKTRTSGSAQWPSLIFLSDSAAASGLLHATPLISTGILSASLTGADGTRYVGIEHDIFGPTVGGIIVPTSAVPSVQQVTTLFNAILAQTNTGVTPVDERAAEIFKISELSALVSKYSAEEAFPSAVGFLSWHAARHPEVTLFPGRDGSGVSLSIVIGAERPVIALNDNAVVKTNAMLVSLAQALRAAGEGNVAAPVINNMNQITDSEVSGIVAIGIRVALPSLSITVETAKTYGGIFRLKANFALWSSTYSNIDATYDYVARTPTIIAKTSFFSRYDSNYVGLDENNNLIYDQDVNIATLLSAARVAVNYLENLEWSNRKMVPVNLLAGMTSDFTTMYETVAPIIDALESYRGQRGALSVALALQDVMRAASPSDTGRSSFAPRVSVNSNNQLRFTSVSYVLTEVSIQEESTPWHLAADTARLRVPIIVATRLGGTTNSNLRLTSTAQGSWRGFSIPFAYHMLGATTVDSVATISLNLPTASSLNIAMNILPARGDSFTAAITDTLLHDAVSTPQFSTTGNNPQLVNPREIWANLRDIVFQATSWALQHPLNVIVPPLQQTLAEVNTRFPARITEIQSWVTLQTASSGAILVTDSICANKMPSAIEFNFTINTMPPVLCDVSELSGAQTIDTFAAALSSGFINCGLGDFLTVSVFVADEENPACGSVAFYPATPGILYKVAITASTQLLISPTNTRQLTPSFGTFDDLNTLLFLVLETPWTGATISTLPANAISGFVPDELASVFPSELPMITIPVPFVYQDSISEGLTLQEVLTSSDGSALNLQGATVTAALLELSYFGNFGTVYGVAPPATIAGFSNLGAEGTDMNTPIPMTDNSFELVVGYQRRTTNLDFELVQSTSRVTLTPGKPFGEAMLNDVVPQLNPDVQALVAVQVQPGREEVASPDQIRFTASRKEVSPGVWHLPVYLSIQNTNMVGIRNFTTPTLTTVNVVTDVNLRAKLEISIESSEGSATVGVFDGLVGGGIVGTGSIEYLAALKAPYTSVGGLGTATTVDEHFYRDFELTANTEFKVEAHDVTVPDITDAPPTESFDFEIDESAIVEGSEQLGTYLERLKEWSTTIGDASSEVKAIWEGFKAVNTSSLCSLLTSATALANQMSASPLASAPLPFASKTFGELIESVVNERLETAIGRVCENGDSKSGMSVGLFCLLLSEIFEKEICGQKTVTPTSFSVELTFWDITKEIQDQFRLDVGGIFGGGDVPFGIGTSGDLMINAGVNGNIMLAVDFGSNGNGMSVSIGPASLQVFASLEASGNIVAAFGPVRGDLANAKLSIGSPASITAILGGDSGFEIVVEGMASLSAAISLAGQEVCSISIQIDNLGTFLGGHGGLVISREACNKENFVAALKAAIESNPVLDFFANSGLAIFQMQDGLRGFQGRLLSPQVFGRLAIPLVDKLIAKAMMEIFEDLLGADKTNELIQGLSAVSANVLTTGNFTQQDRTAILQVVLNGLTHILCDKLKPMECPATPDASMDEFRWILPFGKRVEKPVLSIDFGLGGHGLASLNLTCQAQFIWEYRFSFTLVYSKTHGLSVSFNDTRPFAATAALSFPGECKLSGHLGFLGAQIVADTDSAVYGELALESNWKPSAKFEARLGGTGQFGFAGPLAEKITRTSNSIQALPHYRARISFAWYWALNSRISAPRLSLNDTEMCLGTIIGKLMGDISAQARKVLDPLKPVLGEDGILMKKVKAVEFLLGREMTVIELLEAVAEFYCSDRCFFDKKVFEALKTFIRIYQQMQQFTDLLGVGDEGCGVTTKIGEFIADFRKPKVEPEEKKENPFKGLDFSTYEAKIRAEPITKTYTGIQTSVEGKFGIKLTALDNPTDKLLGMILGQDVEILEITIPSFTISVAAHWGVYVWFSPPIQLGVEISASLTVKPGAILYTSRGIWEMINTGKIGKLLNGLAVRTMNPDGTPLWPLSGTIRLQGYATVDLLLIDGTIYVFIQLEGMARIIDVNGVGYVSFDTLFWMIKDKGLDAAVAWKLELSAGFGIRLRLCIPLIFTKKCFTLVQKEWKATLMKTENDPTPIAAVADEGTGGVVEGMDGEIYGDPNTPATEVNLDVAQPGEQCTGDCGVAPGFFFNMVQTTEFAYQADVEDTPTFMFQSLPDGRVATSFIRAGSGPKMPPMIRDTKPRIIRFKGNPGGNPVKYRVHKLSQLLQTAPNARIEMMQESYYDADRFEITEKGIIPNSPNTPGVQVRNGCETLTMAKPLMQATVSMAGVPCSTLIYTDSMSNVSLKGEPASYAGKPVVINDKPWHLTSTVKAKQVKITTAKMTADQLDLTFPEAIPVLNVYGHPTEDGVYRIEANPGGQSTRVEGGSANDLFEMPKFEDIKGSLYMQGGPGVNSIVAVLDTHPEEGMNVATGPTHLHHNSQAAAWNNIQKRKFVLNGKATHKSQFTLLAPEPSAFIEVEAKGEPNGHIVQQVTGCDGAAEIRISLGGGGEHTVKLGSNNVISGFGCSVRIAGGPDEAQVDTVIVEASADDRPLLFTVNDRSLIAFDPSDTTKFFYLFFTSVERVVVQANEQSEVHLVSPASGTEYHFMTNDVHAKEGHRNPATICRTSETVLLTGAFDVVIGPHRDICNVDIGPFRPPDSGLPANSLGYFNGMVAIKGHETEITPIQINSHSDGDQLYRINHQCMSPLNANKEVPELRSKPSPWMQGLLQEHGFDARLTECYLYWLGEVTFDITTGAGNDYFDSSDVDFPLTLDMGHGDNQFYGTSFTRPVKLTFGEGNDHVEAGNFADVFFLSLGGGNNYYKGDNYATTVVVSMGDGNDHFEASNFENTLDILMGEGDNVFKGSNFKLAVTAAMGNGNDNFEGTNFSDRLTVLMGHGDNNFKGDNFALAVTLSMGDGDDTFDASNFHDTLEVGMGGGDNSFKGNQFALAVNLAMGDGNDIFEASNFHYTLDAHMGGGDNSFKGEHFAKAVLLSMGDGNDIFEASNFGDILDAVMADGDNSFKGDTFASTVTVMMGDGVDIFDATKFNGTLDVIMGAGDNSFKADTVALAVTVTMGDGNDKFEGYNFNDIVSVGMGHGANTFHGENVVGPSSVYMGDGRDTFTGINFQRATEVKMADGENVFTGTDFLQAPLTLTMGRDRDTFTGTNFIGGFVFVEMGDGQNNFTGTNFLSAPVTLAMGSGDDNFWGLNFDSPVICVMGDGTNNFVGTTFNALTLSMGSGMDHFTGLDFSEGNVNVNMGDGLNWFVGMNFENAPTEVHMGNDRDWFNGTNWINSPFVLAMGNGENTFNGLTFTADAAISMGDDQDYFNGKHFGSQTVVSMGNGHNNFYSLDFHALNLTMGDGLDRVKSDGFSGPVNMATGDGKGYINAENFINAPTIITMGKDDDYANITNLHNSPFSMNMGDGSNFFQGIDFDASPTSLVMGSGDDAAILSNATASFSIDLGAGWDKLQMVAPLGDGTVALGADTVPDVVDVWQNAARPHVFGTSLTNVAIGPLGVKDGDISKLHQVHYNDIVHVHSGSPFHPAFTIPPPATQNHANDTLLDPPAQEHQEAPTLKKRNTGPIVWVNITIPSFVFKYDLQDEVHYGVGEVADQATIVLNALEISGKPPVNWQVDVMLETVARPAYVNIESEANTNGVVAVTLPGLADPSKRYNVEVQQTSVDSLAKMNAGLLQLLIQHPSHMAIISNQSPLDLKYSSTPGDADMVVDGTPSSTITLGRVTNHILLVDVGAFVPIGVLETPAAMIFTGDTTSVATEFSHDDVGERVFYKEGCMTSIPALPTRRGATPWFMQQLSDFGVPASSIGCYIYTDAIDSFYISAEHVEAVNLDKDVSVHHLGVIGGNATLRDDVAWRNPNIENSLIEVDGRYDVTIDDKKHVSVFATPVDGPATRLNMDCGAVDANQGNWWIGCETMSQYALLSTASTGCNLRLCQHWLRFNFVGDTGCYIATMDFQNYTDIQGDPRRIDINDLSVQSSEPNFYSTWNSNLTVFFHMSIANSTDNRVYSRVIREDPHTLIVDGSASVTIISDVENSFYLSESDAEFDAKTHAVYAKRNDTLEPDEFPPLYCLQPSPQCFAEAWMDIQFNGPAPCQTIEQMQTCQTKTVLKVISVHPILCDIELSSLDWALEIRAITDSDFDNPDSSIAFKVSIGVFFFAFVLITTVFWIFGPTYVEYKAALALKGALSTIRPITMTVAAMLPSAIMMNWSRFIVTAYLKTPADLVFNPGARSIIDGAQEVVVNFFDGYYCGPEEEDYRVFYKVVSSFYGILIMAGLIVGVSAFFIMAIRGRRLSRHYLRIQLTRRILMYCSLFLLLAPVAAHSLSSTITKLASFVAAVPLLGFLYDGWSVAPEMFSRKVLSVWPAVVNTVFSILQLLIVLLFSWRRDGFLPFSMGVTLNAIQLIGTFAQTAALLRHGWDATKKKTIVVGVCLLTLSLVPSILGFVFLGLVHTSQEYKLVIEAIWWIWVAFPPIQFVVAFILTRRAFSTAFDVVGDETQYDDLVVMNSNQQPLLSGEDEGTYSEYSEYDDGTYSEDETADSEDGTSSSRSSLYIDGPPPPDYIPPPPKPKRSRAPSRRPPPPPPDYIPAPPPMKRNRAPTRAPPHIPLQEPEDSDDAGISLLGYELSSMIRFSGKLLDD